MVCNEDCLRSVDGNIDIIPVPDDILTQIAELLTIYGQECFRCEGPGVRIIDTYIGIIASPVAVVDDECA